MFKCVVFSTKITNENREKVELKAIKSEFEQAASKCYWLADKKQFET